MDNEFNNKVEEMKDALVSERWNDISSKVWGDTENQKALSQAARSKADGLPDVEFKKDENGSLVLEFSRPGVTGWIKDTIGGKPQIKF
ncbi:MAG: hypothetical protein K2W95_24605 [Candidatus Obscuribacterales bacterium]|nr:hypothetical protein [Candidatus Obscuribacterales bacterium]